MIKKLLLSLILFFVFVGVSSAQEISPSPTVSPTPAPVNYSLPYPGMLPDHPLYKLKFLRDNIVLFITRDPIKKAEYHLLLADKRINMAKFLVDKENVELAKETALKGENEYTLLVFLLKDVNKKPDKNFYERLEKAALKHQEVLRGIIDKTGSNDKKTFQTVLEFSQRNLEELKKIYKNS